MSLVSSGRAGRTHDLTFTPGADSRAALLCAAAKAVRLAPDKITELRIHRRSVDARKKQDVRVVYTVDVTVDGKEEKILQMARNPKAAIAVTTIYEPPRAAQTDERPVVIGVWAWRDVRGARARAGRAAAHRA